MRYTIPAVPDSIMHSTPCCLATEVHSVSTLFGNDTSIFKFLKKTSTHTDSCTLFLYYGGIHTICTIDTHIHVGITCTMNTHIDRSQKVLYVNVLPYRHELLYLQCLRRGGLLLFLGTFHLLPLRMGRVTLTDNRTCHNTHTHTHTHTHTRRSTY